MKGARPLTDSEVHQVSNSFRGRFAHRDRTLFVLGIKTGLRISELLSLTVGDVLQHGRWGAVHQQALRRFPAARHVRHAAAPLQIRTRSTPN